MQRKVSGRSVSTGRDLGQDPTIRLDPLDVGEEGLQVDVAYPVPLVGKLVAGIVDAEVGGLPDGTFVRFLPETLSGYETLDADWTLDIPLFGNGSFLGRVVPGVYSVEVVPNEPAATGSLTPVRIDDVLVEADMPSESLDMGTITLLPYTAIDGVVGLPDPEETSNTLGVGGLSVICREVGFDQREWSTLTDSTGVFHLEVPANPLDCLVSPPAEPGGFAQLDRTLDPLANAMPEWVFEPGVPVSGQVRNDGVALAFATVLIRGANDEQLGLALTDEEGRFETTIAPRPGGSEF